MVASLQFQIRNLERENRQLRSGEAYQKLKQQLQENTAYYEKRLGEEQRGRIEAEQRLIHTDYEHQRIVIGMQEDFEQEISVLKAQHEKELKRAVEEARREERKAAREAAAEGNRMYVDLQQKLKKDRKDYIRIINDYEVKFVELGQEKQKLTIRLKKALDTTAKLSTELLRQKNSEDDPLGFVANLVTIAGACKDLLAEMEKEENAEPGNSDTGTNDDGPGPESGASESEDLAPELQKLNSEDEQSDPSGSNGDEKGTEPQPTTTVKKAIVHKARTHKKHSTHKSGSKGKKSGGRAKSNNNSSADSGTGPSGATQGEGTSQEKEIKSKYTAKGRKEAVEKAQLTSEEIAKKLEEIKSSEGVNISYTAEDVMQICERAVDTIGALMGTINVLNAQNNKNSENSSIPSSKDALRAKVHNGRAKMGRKQGGQNGHKGHCRKQYVSTLDPIFIEAPPEILNDQSWHIVKGERPEVIKKVVEVKTIIEVQPYYAFRYRQTGTGKRFTPHFPENCANEVNYGPSVYALIYLLKNMCRVSEENIRKLLLQITRGELTVSRGMINGINEKFACRTTAEYNEIFESLENGDIMHVDLTGFRLNGKLVNIIVCSNKDKTWYGFREHKGHDAIKGSPLEKFAGIVIHDHDITFYSYGSGHAECHAHHLRYLLSCIENEPDLKWAKLMYELLKLMNKVREAQNRILTPDQIGKFEEAYKFVIAVARKEYSEHVPTDYVEGYNLFVRLQDYDANLRFLHDPRIDFTNNLAERLLRRCKRILATIGTLRGKTANSGEQFCRSMTVFETYVAHSEDCYGKLIEIFSRERGIKRPKVPKDVPSDEAVDEEVEQKFDLENFDLDVALDNILNKKSA